MTDYDKISTNARIKVLEMIHKAGTSHIGSNLSCIDILSVLFEKLDIPNDELVVSKGWVAAAVYYFLAEKGVIPKDDLERFCGPTEEEYIGLIEPHGKFGLRFAGGSMGYGLPAAVGFALAKKWKGETGTVYCLMSDGELAIGTTWEAALLAGQHNLTNLVVMVDSNGWQAMGKTHEILETTFPILPRTWSYTVANGHNFASIEAALGQLRLNPLLIDFGTTKGKGVSFMENDNRWHYLHTSEDDYQKALKELHGTD